MYSRTDARRFAALRRRALRMLALAALVLLQLLAPPSAALAAASMQEVRNAAAQVAKDPDLGKTEKSRRLRFKDTGEKPDEKKRDDGSLDWLKDFIDSVVKGARLLVWALGALAVALLVVGIRRWIRVRADARPLRRGPLPSHVQSLDIRPESLPADVGAAAAQLWSRGEHLPALSLLYRGALSRLVHGHGVPIRAASTEGECVSLAEKRLSAAPALFFARLVTAWQLAVYGGRSPQPDDVLALCRDFSGQLGTANASTTGSAA